MTTRTVRLLHSRPGLLVLVCGGLLLGAGLLWTDATRERREPAPTPVPPASPPPGERITRLFWQDRSDDSLQWADLWKGSSWQLQPAAVHQFPRLDVERQDLVQMDILEGMLLVGVRDKDDGQFQSGWVAVQTGIREVSHGDHSDWKFDAPPSVQLAHLDKQQGNPAHLYVYDGSFFLANDQSNGFTHIHPEQLHGPAPHGQFYPGGGNHITMAALDNAVCYATWIDGGGPDKGRVDVVDLRRPADQNPAYTFHVSSGGLHGATANSGRVFLAPADGVCWVAADVQASQNAEAIEVHHIPLGEDPETEKPLRTGAFVSHRNWVLFTTGTADASALCLIDARAPNPEVVKVPIEVVDGLALVTPRVIRTRWGKRYAFLFQDRQAGDLTEQLTIVDLDPDRDLSFADAKVIQTLPVGASQVEGHHGHHSIAFDPSGRFACVTNPGDGTIGILDLQDLQFLATLQVGGSPAAICCTGAVSDH